MQQFGIFAKYWGGPDVKTRLAATIGKQTAGELYRCFIEVLLQRFADAGDSRVLAYSPPDSRAAFAALADDCWLLQPQQGDELGERMKNYFDAAFRRGAERVVLIGSDSPQLSSDVVQLAFRMLGAQSVVLGPATDGGYYLIGAACQTPPVFDGIEWSTSRVLAQTIEKLQERCIDFAELPLAGDVDDEADLRRLERELAASPHPDRELQRAIRLALASSIGSKP